MTNKNPVGRPLAFKTPEELKDAIDEYFAYCDNRIKTIVDKDGREITINHPAPYTMSGLARRLGVDRDTIINYSHRDNFSALIREARDRVQEDVEIRLMETRNEKGAMFNLKNNFGWKDRSEQKLEGEITHKYEDMTDEELERAIKDREDRISRAS